MLCDWLGEHVLPSLEGSELEVRVKNRNLAVVRQAPPVLGFWLQKCGLAARRAEAFLDSEVESQNSIVL